MMLTRMRRSAGLLMAVFVGHLSMVAGGAVCVVPGMAPMSGAMHAEAGSAGEPMAGMLMHGAGEQTDAAAVAPPADGASSEHAPCSGPASGGCASTMPCTTALGADSGVVLAPSAPVKATVQRLSVRVPVSSGSAPEIPPPRA